MASLGVDSEGSRHVLGVGAASSGNQAQVEAFLQGLRQSGLDARRRYLLVIEGTRALCGGVERVLGTHNLVQRCRLREVQRVCAQLPDKLAPEIQSEMREAFQLPYREGAALLKQRAQWLQLRHPGAAGCLREGLEQSLTINRLQVSSSLRMCLGSTYIVGSTLCRGEGKIRAGLSSQSALRWAATLLLEREKGFRKIQGWRDLWMLKAALQGPDRVPKTETDKRSSHPDTLESGKAN